MGSGRAKRFAAIAVAALLLASISAVLVASAATNKAQRTPTPRAMSYSCAFDLYNANKVMHFVARPSSCQGSGKRLINFKKDYPVYTCRKEHGGFASRPKRFQFPNGIYGHGPAGLMRLVSSLSKCAPHSQPNETPHTLPATSTRLFCAAKRGGELRWVGSRTSCNSREFLVALAPIGSGPVANDDQASTDEDHATNVNVLANDRNTPTSHSNAGLQIASTDTTGTKGAVSVNPDGTIAYNPHGQFESLKPGQTATDTFKYRVKRGTRTSAPATVTITVSGVNDLPIARDDTAHTDSAHTTAIPVLTNDTDAEGDPLSVSVDTSGTQGNVTVNGDGTVTYDPNHKFDSLKPGDTAHDTFKYKANDGHGDSNVATVDVTIDGFDDPPVVTTSPGDLHYTEGDPATVLDGGVTVSDPDSAKLQSAQIKIVDGLNFNDELHLPNPPDPVAPAPGGITAFYDSNAGVLSLTAPPGGATLADWQAALRTVTFQSASDNPFPVKKLEFTVNDGNSDSAVSTKTINTTNINDAPQVQTSPGSSAFTEDSPAVAVDPAIDVSDPDSLQLQGATVAITANFSSADGDTLSFTDQNGITGSYNSGTGVLTLSGAAAVSDYQAAIQSITFSNSSNTPSTATRTVSFKVNDGSLDSNTDTKDVTVTAHNDAPVAVADGPYSTNEDTPLTVPTPGVLGNDSDAEGSAITAVLDTGPSHASSFALNSDGSFSYTPNPDYNGPDSFTYHANDGTDGGNVVTVSLTISAVNDAPVVDLNGTGTAGSNATASFTEDSPAASVAPAADLSDVDDTNLESATITLTNHPDGASESLSVNTSGTSITASSYNSGTGVLTLSGSDTKAHYQQVIRSLKYDNSSNTPDTTDRVVNVKVNDGDVDSNEPHSTVSVTAHNDAPVADNQSTSTNEDNAVGITLTGSDPEGSALTFAADQPAHGSVSPTNASSVTYTPDADYCGPDSFTFHTNDGSADSANGTVSITVNCVNDAPVVDLSGTGGFNSTANFTEDSGPASIAAAALVTDVDSPNLSSATITLTNRPDGVKESLAVNTAGTSITASAYNSGTGVLTLSGSDTRAHYESVIESLTYNNTSDTPDTTDRVVNVKVNDGSLDSNEPHVTVSVTAHNDAPVADDQSTSTSEDNAVGITLTGSDPEGSALTFAADQPSHGSVSPTNASSVTYTPNADYCGPDSFTFHTNDGSADSANGTVSITVNCVNDAPVVDLNGSGSGGIDNTASFTEDAGAATLAPSAEVSDVDSANMASATVTLTNRPDGVKESLAATVTGTSITADAYDNSTGQLFLHGSDTKAHYQQVLRSVVYNNSSQNPDTANRLIDFKVNDGALDSATATTTLSVNRANDAPTADDQLGLSTNEDTALPITLTGGDIDGDSITFHSDQPAHGSVTPTTGSSVTYTPNQDYCGPDTFTFHTNDGTVDSANGTIVITVNCVNDAPVVDLNGPAAGTGTTPSFAEQIAHTGGATTLAPNGTVSDVDDANIESLTVTLTNHPDGSSEFLTADTTGTSITADAYNSTTGVLLLHGTDTKAHYQQVLRTVAYENDAAPPDPTNRTINFVANDGDLDSNTAVATVAVLPLNAPPAVDLNSGTLGFDTTASFTEDSGPATLAPSATVTDADDPNLVSATVTLTNRPDGGAESLSANVAGTSITADAYVPATGVLFLHGSDTKANYQQVLRTVAYNNTSNTPTTTNRSITFKVNDGQDDSNTATADTSVTATNDPPTATDQSVSTNEDTAKGITLSGTDPENDTLSFTHDSMSANGGTIDSPGSASVTYTPAADYCGPDSFNFQVDDGNGGTDTGTVSITVTCVNDAPVVDLNGGGAGIDNNAAFTENQPAVTLATGATVTDVDNANLSSATVVLTNHPDGAAEGLTAVTAGTSITADAYDTSTGVLFLHGSDTKANYQQVIRSVAYNNTSDNPDTTNRDITWKVNDGSLDSATAHTTLSVTAANDPPTLDLNGASAGVNETAGYTEDQPPTTLTPNALASDPDNSNLQSATITLTNHPDGALESLSVDTSGTSISAVAYNSGTGVLSLSGSDTVAHYQQVLRTIAYLNTSQNADTTNRVVTYVANDGSANSNSPTATVTITVVNDPPVVDMNGGGGGIDSNAAFVEDSSPNVVGSGPVNLGASATVSDVDNSSLASATLTLTNHPDGAAESLSVNLAGTSITTGGYNSSTGVLTLTGPDTTAHFQQVIQSAKYNNTSNTPDPTNRDITTKVNDGAADSTVAHTTVSVTPTNDAPVANADTFNATNSAIGNTTLNVNDTATTGAGAGDGRPPTPDPTDTSPVTDRPHKEITGNIFANDTDPDNASSGFTATPGTFATNDGGTVTIQADGDFNFEPAPSTSCTDTSDFFNYTLNDNSGADPGSSTGTVTVAITGCVWYVNNNDAQGNSGTSEKPFDTLAQAQTASAANNTIFVYDGDDTTTGYNTGINLKSGQTLQSEGATLTIGSDTLHSADAANKASLTNNNADVVSLNNGTVVKSFNIDPQGTGGGICGGTACGGNATAGSTLDDINIVDNGTKGTQAGLELNGSTGTFNISNLTVNNGDGSSATTGDEGVKLNNAGTVNFASTGTISLTTNGAAALDAAAGAGTTSLGSASTFDDITVTNSGNGGVLLNGTTGSGTAFGDGSGNDLQLTTVSGSPAAFSAQTAGSFSVPSAGQSDVSATGGPAVDVVSSSGSTMAFDGVSSTNSANDGINVDSIGTGTFSATSGTIGGEAGIGFDLNGGSGAITYPGTFNNGSGSLVAEVTGRTGGVVSLSGSMNDTNDAGGGVNIASNTGGSTVFSGATKQFNTGASDAVTFSNSDGHTFVLSGGGTDIDTTSGNGINATTSGTFQVSGTGNTIDSTALSSTNRALNVVDTDAAAAGINFDHISSSGGANGIRLNNTGANNALTVTGTGPTDSGGTITSTTGSDDSSTSPVGTGVALKDTKGVSLTHMHITNNSNYGIRGDSVSNGPSTCQSSGAVCSFAMDHSEVDGANGSETVQGGSSPFNEASLRFTNLTGSSTLNTNTISGGASDNLAVVNSSGTLNRLNLTGNTFNNNSNTQGNVSALVNGSGTATTNVTVDSNTFTASRSFDTALLNTGTAGDFVVTNNTFSQSRPTTGPNAPATGAGDIEVYGGANSDVTMNVASNNMTGATGSAILLAHDIVQSGSTYGGTVNANTIGVAGTANSGSLEGSGVDLNRTGGSATGATSVAITNNQIRQYNNFGIILESGSGGLASDSGNVDATVTGNTIANPGTNVNISSIFQGIQLNSATTDGQTFDWCLNMKGNSIVGSGRNGGTDFRLRQRFDTKVTLPGYGGTAFDTTAVTNFIANQNDAAPNDPAANAPVPTGAALTDQPSGGQGFVNGAACTSG